VLEIELDGLAGDETLCAQQLAELLGDFSDPDCHLAQLLAFTGLMRLLLDSDSLQATEALNGWMARHAQEQSGLLGRARFLFVLWQNFVAHRRCELAHPYYRDSLLRGAAGEEPLPFAKALEQLEASALDLLQADQLLACYPREAAPLSFTLETLRDAAVQAMFLMRGERTARSFYADRFADALSRGNIIVAAQAAEALAPSLIDSGCATMAANQFHRIKQMRLHLPPMAARRVEYGLFKSAEAAGQADVALLAYRRYVQAVRSLLANPVQAPAFVVSIAETPSVQPTTAPTAPLYLRKAVEIMHRRYAERGVSFDQLAEAVGVSDRTLRAAFTVHLGTSPSTYLRNLRLDAARKKLDAQARNGRPVVSELAKSCGFDHTGRFAKAFAERFGCSPSQYARR
jgi:AraC-like DNA-binding protein